MRPPTKFTSLSKELLRIFCLVLLALSLNACLAFQDNRGYRLESDSAQSPSLTQVFMDKRNLTEAQQIAAKGIEAFEAGDYDLALLSFQKALKVNLGSSALNLLAGLTYHIQAVNEDDSKFALAEEGYKLALRFDPSNWVAFYQLGALALDRRDFPAAQDHFAEALIFAPDDPDLIYNLLVASYYAGDVQTASAMLQRLSDVEPGKHRVLLASSMVNAAGSNHKAAIASLDRLAASGVKPVQVAYLRRRIKDWKAFHIRPAQYAPPQGTGQYSPAQAGPRPSPFLNRPPAHAPASGPSKVVLANEMVVVDLIILRTEENKETTKGVNLLDGLTLQFGSLSSGAAGLSFSETRAKTSASVTNTITKAINIPAITYSLNIANVTNNKAQILARPTLTTTHGQRADFFAGVAIQAATLPSTVGGTGQPVSIQETVGVKLSVTPTMLGNDKVKLLVAAERNFLNTPSAAYTGFTSKLETTQTTLTSTVVMNFGETLILGGLSEEELESSEDGVPFLKDVPLVQYFFNRKTTQDFHRTVLLLVTPRKPAYQYKTDEVKGALRGDSEAVKTLKNRYGDWFKPLPTSKIIAEHMKNSRLYREFRTGDIAIEHWGQQDGFKGRLMDALKFLYY